MLIRRIAQLSTEDPQYRRLMDRAVELFVGSDMGRGDRENLTEEGRQTSDSGAPASLTA